eukprot:2792182-Pleurochrysis_carterae.AAC.2
MHPDTLLVTLACSDKTHYDLHFAHTATTVLSLFSAITSSFISALDMAGVLAILKTAQQQSSSHYDTTTASIIFTTALTMSTRAGKQLEQAGADGARCVAQ